MLTIVSCGVSGALEYFDTTKNSKPLSKFDKIRRCINACLAMFPMYTILVFVLITVVFLIFFSKFEGFDEIKNNATGKNNNQIKDYYTFVYEKFKGIFNEDDMWFLLSALVVCSVIVDIMIIFLGLQDVQSIGLDAIQYLSINAYKYNNNFADDFAFHIVPAASAIIFLLSCTMSFILLYISFRQLIALSRAKKTLSKLIELVTLNDSEEEIKQSIIDFRKTDFKTEKDLNLFRLRIRELFYISKLTETQLERSGRLHGPFLYENEGVYERKKSYKSWHRKLEEIIIDCICDEKNLENITELSKDIYVLQLRILSVYIENYKDPTNPKRYTKIPTDVCLECKDALDRKVMLDPYKVRTFYNDIIKQLEDILEDSILPRESSIILNTTIQVFFPVSLIIFFIYILCSDQRSHKNVLSDVTVNNLRAYKKYNKSVMDLSQNKPLTIYLVLSVIFVIGVGVLLFRNDGDNKFVECTHSVILLLLPLPFVVKSCSGLLSLKHLINNFDIFSEVYSVKNAQKLHIDRLNKISVNIDDYYIIMVDDKFKKTSKDRYVVHKFENLINNNFSEAMKVIESCENLELKEYLKTEIKKEENILFKNIRFDFSKDSLTFYSKGFKYVIHINELLIMRLYGRSGSGKSTLIKIIAGYIEHMKSKAEGVHKGKNVSIPICELSDDSRVLFPEFGNIIDNYMFSHMSTKENCQMIDPNCMEELKNHLKALNMEKYVDDTCLNLLFKYLPLSSGQKTKIQFTKTIFEYLSVIKSRKSFMLLSDELLGSLGDGDKAIIANYAKEKVLEGIRFTNAALKDSKTKIIDELKEKLKLASSDPERAAINKKIDKETLDSNDTAKAIMMFIDHSEEPKRFGYYDIIVEIRDKSLVFLIKTDNNTYEDIETLFGKNDDSIEFNGIKVTREELRR